MTDQLSYDCRACGKNKKLKKVYGCNGNAQDPIEIECFDCAGSNKKCKVCKGSGFEKIYRCPVRFVDEIREFMKFYRFYKSGFLPEADSILDQPNIFMESCLFLDGELNKFRNKEIEDMKSDGKKRA